MIARKIALPVMDGALGRSFESCHDFMLYTLEEQEIAREELISTHLQPDFYAFWLAGMGVTDLIAQNILPASIRRFNQHKINVFVGVRSTDHKALITDCIQGTLETYDIVEHELPLLKDNAPG